MISMKIFFKFMYEGISNAVLKETLDKFLKYFLMNFPIGSLENVFLLFTFLMITSENIKWGKLSKTIIPMRAEPQFDLYCRIFSNLPFYYYSCSDEHRCNSNIHFCLRISIVKYTFFFQKSISKIFKWEHQISTQDFPEAYFFWKNLRISEEITG